MASAVKNGGFLRERHVSLADFYETDADILAGPNWAAQAGSGVAGAIAFVAGGNGRGLKYSFTSSATATIAADIHVPSEFNRADCMFRVQLLAISSIATLTSLVLTPTMRFWRWGAGVKTAIGSTACRRWNTPPTGLDDPIGSASATGTTTLALPLNSAYANAPTHPMLLEFDFTPASTTARTNYPEPDDIGHFRLLATGNTTDATDSLTILRARVIESVHAGFNRTPERFRI